MRLRLKWFLLATCIGGSVLGLIGNHVVDWYWRTPVPVNVSYRNNLTTNDGTSYRVLPYWYSPTRARRNDDKRFGYMIVFSNRVSASTTGHYHTGNVENDVAKNLVYQRSWLGDNDHDFACFPHCAVIDAQIVKPTECQRVFIVKPMHQIVVVELTQQAVREFEKCRDGTALTQNRFWKAEVEPIIDRELGISKVTDAELVELCDEVWRADPQFTVAVHAATDRPDENSFERQVKERSPNIDLHRIRPIFREMIRREQVRYEAAVMQLCEEVWAADPMFAASVRAGKRVDLESFVAQAQKIDPSVDEWRVWVGFFEIVQRENDLERAARQK